MEDSKAIRQNGGFGWRQQNVPSADFDFDTGRKAFGLARLGIIFDRTQNIDFGASFSMGCVSRARAIAVRDFSSATDHISTDSGMRFEN